MDEPFTKFISIQLDIKLRQFMQDPIYQPLRPGRIWHKVNF